jgi:hypothetical protein
LQKASELEELEKKKQLELDDQTRLAADKEKGA